METTQSESRVSGWQRRPVSVSTPPPCATQVSELATVVAAAPGLSVAAQYKAELHKQLVEMVDRDRLSHLPVERQRHELRNLILKYFDSNPTPFPFAERERVVREVLDDILGLGPLEPLLLDPTINDILVNGAKEVYVERRGILELSDVRFRDDDHVLQVIRRIVERINRRIDESSPMVDARLPDGSRVNAIIPPLSLRGPAISIRRFGGNARTIDDLVALNMLTPEMSAFLQAAVRSRLNVIISGGTGSGKTTLLNALSHAIPDRERIVTIEDSAELRLQQRHVMPLEARPANLEGKGAVTVRDLVRNALRMRPDRIVIGECRGAETLDMLQAMNTGHDGSLTTLHANNPRDTLTRIETMVLMAGYDLPVRVIRQQISSAVNLIVQTNRLNGGIRRVTAISEIVGMEQDTIMMQNLFEYHQVGVTRTGVATGVFKTTGIRSIYAEKMAATGNHLAPELFTERVLLQDAPRF